MLSSTSLLPNISASEDLVIAIERLSQPLIAGPDPNVFTDPRNLLSRLGDRRLARPGPLGLGVATDVDGRLLGCSGRPVEWLWTLGSLRQGDQLESTAVPEIRQQACAIATEVRRFVSRCRRVQQGGKEGMPTVRRGEAGP